MAEDLRQPDSHFLGGSRICSDQRRHTIQGVEQKVWIDLSTEGSEFRLQKLLDQLRLPASPFNILLFEIDRLQTASDGETDRTQKFDLCIEKGQATGTRQDRQGKALPALRLSESGKCIREWIPGGSQSWD